jgi:hypothetical protein
MKEISYEAHHALEHADALVNCHAKSAKNALTKESHFMNL